MKNIIKLVAILLLSVSVTSCGWFERKLAVYTGYSKMCVDGVSYLQFSSGASVQYDITGKIVPCGK